MIDQEQPYRMWKYLIEISKLNSNEELLIKGADKTRNFPTDYLHVMSETTKPAIDVSFNSILKKGNLPNREYIENSLQKVQEITVAVHLLWTNKKIAGKITADVIKIVNTVCSRNFSFCNGKSLRCQVGGLLYLMGFRYDYPKKQREIAFSLQITDVSVRLYYKKWLKEFPDLFQDIIIKFADRDSRNLIRR
jgi:hypothetical protein